jgi:copper chaperone CopZ
MIKLLLIIVISIAGIPAMSQFSKSTLQATGLTCAMCSNAINKALQKVPFVESVRSDIKNSAFEIVFKKGETVHVDALKEAVEDAGFAVGSLKLTGQFTGMKIGKDEHVKIGNENFHFVDASSQLLDGEQTITVVDKNFVTEKQYKKYSSATKMSCFKSGKTASCCEKQGISPNERVYHVII